MSKFGGYIYADMHGGVDPIQCHPLEVVDNILSATVDAYNWGARRKIWGDGTTIPTGKEKRKRKPNYDNSPAIYQDGNGPQPGERFIHVQEEFPMTEAEIDAKYQQVYDALDDLPYPSYIQIDAPDKEELPNIIANHLEYKQIQDSILKGVQIVAKLHLLVEDNIHTMEKLGYEVTKEKWSSKKDQCKITYTHKETGKIVKSKVTI